MRTLDPRAPLVLDTRELGRRPGSQRTLTRTVPAPAELGIEILGVPEGSPVDLDLRLGEGTGALLALPMVQSAARTMHEVATFDSAGVTEKG